MKMQLLTGVAFTVSLAVGTIILTTQRPSFAKKEHGFYCDTSTGVPVTMYQKSTGGVEPWIRWTSHYFTSAGYSPQERCQEVSSRLETYRRNKQLKFITVGSGNNGQRVVCTASQENGPCEGLIFTLKPDEDAVKTLNYLLAWRKVTPSSSESVQLYIDVRPELED